MTSSLIGRLRAGRPRDPWITPPSLFDVPEDQDCLFRSLVDAGTHAFDHREMQHRLARYLTARPDPALHGLALTDLMAQELPLHQYVAHIAVIGWGTSIEITAYAHAFATKVRVFRRRNHDLSEVQLVMEVSPQDPQFEIILDLHHEAYYRALQQPYARRALRGSATPSRQVPPTSVIPCWDLPHIHPVPDDGDCLFYALAYAGKHDFDHRDLRRQVAFHLLANPDLDVGGIPLSLLVDQDLPFEDYARHIAVLGWGGTAEIAAYADLFCTSVRVVQPDPSSAIRYQEILHIRPATSVAQITLHYNGFSHYQVFRPPSGARCAITDAALAASSFWQPGCS